MGRKSFLLFSNMGILFMYVLLVMSYVLVFVKKSLLKRLALFLHVCVNSALFFFVVMVFCSLLFDLDLPLPEFFF